MIDCPRCGTPNAPDARFCNSCGNSLVTRVGVQERRVVTALFADLARSTSMGEKLDPEVVRGMVGRFFELATAQIESRGGTVEKFSGDAVMAVFGLPQAHEDDPERAVRAAIAIRDGIAAIAADTQERHGIALQARIGIESGEVVVGDPFGGATMATGDTMNVAARLEQQAEPGEIVIGPTVWEQVRDLVTAEALGDLALKGRDQNLQGWRVLDVASEVGRPRGLPGLEAPLTGRDEELNLLLNAARRAKQENKATLFTILGVPGVGKSRLVREASARLAGEGWSTVKGRCLPYGDGITYWPVADIVRELCGITPDMSIDEAAARLADASPDPEVADRLALIVGAAGGGATGGGEQSSGGDREIAWGFRLLVEHLVRDRGPMMLVFEDIHWAEPPLLDLIEYLVTWTRDAPLLVVCPSRPELIDTRPAWGAGRMEGSRISLEPLSEAESRSLLGALLTVDDLPPELRQRILDRAEGNPLFVEEVVRMLIEEGVVERKGDHWVANQDASSVRVPESVEALIRARLDTLPAPERKVLQAASVVGRIFQRSAVTAISPGEGAGPIDRHLEDAVLRDLITDERVPTEPTFRFRHILIRDVAYATLPKAQRAELHGAVADWLRTWAGARMDEFIEIEAYHLEQRLLLQQELTGRVDPTDKQRAIDALFASGQRAKARDDSRAALSFTERALALEPQPGEQRLELTWLHIDSLRRQSQYRRAGELAAKLEIEAHEFGRRDIEGRAILAKAGDQWISPEKADREGAFVELSRALELLEASGDDLHLLGVLQMLGYGGWWTGDLGEATRYWSRQREVARAHGWASQEAEAVSQLARAKALGGEFEPVRELLAEARELAAKGSSRLIRAEVERVFGSFNQRVDAAIAEEALSSALPTLEEFGDHEEQYVALSHLGDIAMRRDEKEVALALHRRALEHVEAHVGYKPESLRRMAQLLIELGRTDEAEPIIEDAVKMTAKGDFVTIASTGMVLGLLREAQGNDAEAERLLRDALTEIERTGFALSIWEEQLMLAEFLLRHGRNTEAEEFLEKARANNRRYGPQSPILEYIDRRAARVAEVGAPKST
ncbi:MAG: AAA family ATPase [Chloroflexota bacterium]